MKTKAANASSNAGGMMTAPSFRKRQALTSCPSRRKAVSHRMVASEPVTDKIRAEIDADQHCTGCLRRRVGRLHGGACNQAGGKVVHQVAGECEQHAGAPGRTGLRAFCGVVQHCGDVRKQARPAERFDKDEEPCDKRQNSPRNAAQHRPWR